jgi:AcrR family transcriptional regulator
MPRVVPEYKAQARARIIATASEVIRRKGYLHATMDDIAKELGVSKGALYLYFRTKLELLFAIQSQSREEILTRWQPLLDSGDVAEGLAAAVDPLFSGEVDPSIWVQLVAEAGSTPELRQALQVDQREDARLMRRFLLQLEKRGRIPKMQDPDAVADAVMTLLQGMFTRVILGGPAKDAHRKLVQSLRLVLRV